MTTVLLALGTPLLQGTYADVPFDHWAYSAVEEITTLGLMEGTPNGLFQGDEPVSRFQLATVLVRLLHHLDKRPGGAAQTDLQPLLDHLAKPAMRVAVRPAPPAAEIERELAAFAPVLADLLTNQPHEARLSQE